MPTSTLIRNRQFVLRRTDQLSTEEKGQFGSLFARVFGKALTADQFERKYARTPLGYSHHALMVAEDEIVGAYNLVPYRYECFGSQKLFGLSVDAMIDAGHRSGPFNMVKLARLACQGAVTDGVVFAFGFPNDQAYVFTTKVLKWRHLGDLEFYVLPINIGALRQSLTWANALSRLCAAGLARRPVWGGGRTNGVAIKKVGDRLFREHRYDDRHRSMELKDGGICHYRICKEDGGVRTLYIIDVTPMQRDRFSEAVRRLHQVAAAEADLMLYVGRLPFRPPRLLRVPPKKRPRTIRMCGRLLDPQGGDGRLFDIRNWNINISNFDVR